MTDGTCGWATKQADYRAYHDEEWGRPQTDDRRLLEKLCLEGFQSGLSWLTILRKRPAFRRAFADFDCDVVAAYTEEDVARLLADPGIVRHRGKIEATIANARATQQIRARHGSLAAWLWRFAPPPGPAPASLADVPGKTPAAVALARALKAEGFRFVGPTTAYAFMQAMGMVNDHLAGCPARAAAAADRAAFVPPTP
ncbi:MAG: DNA-3-methyladenine glycosylase I [Myxococcales bacterium]|nr:DNA-3-methyladenine glycosylase I [Myxococcales bacterium]